MVDPQHQKLIQILVTNRCQMSCTHCSQMCPHQTNKFDMTLEEVENALKTLQDYPGHIGLMGGEPTLHPQFSEILALYRKYVPVKARRELWTNGAKYEKYRVDIERTFYEELVAYNEHEEAQPCWHQPNNIAANEVFNGWVTMDTDKDNKLMWRCIDNCWVNNRWSAMITPRGAFYCEVAAARSHALDGAKGIRVQPGWWKEPIETYKFIIDDLCPQCSMCLPMDMRPNDKQEYDDVSSRVRRRLEKAGSKASMKDYDLAKIRQFYQCREFELETDYLKRGGFVDFPEWIPWNYRDLEQKKHKPEDICHDKNNNGQGDKLDQKPVVSPDGAGKARGRPKAQK